MRQSEFHKLFKVPGPAVTPVIHVIDAPQTIRNIEIVIGEGAQGVFLINHDFGVDKFLPILRHARETFPYLWLGVNFLAVTGEDAFPVLGNLQSEGCPIVAYWADDARIDERRAYNDQADACRIAAVREASDWTGLYFGGTAFKKQREVATEDYAVAAKIATEFMDVVTTSGIATGHETEKSKTKVFRDSVGDAPLALASGITPDNARNYARIDCFLVATGINHDGEFYNIDPAKLRRLMRITREIGGGKTDG